MLRYHFDLFLTTEKEEQCYETFFWRTRAKAAL